MEYKLIKDNRRKKMAMKVDYDGTVVITVPKWTRKSRIDAFYKNNLNWIAERREQIKIDSSKYIQLTKRDINSLKNKAKSVMAAKTAFYGNKIGIKPDKVKITSARKTWGTCRRQGDRYTICYSYRTMFLSDMAQSYIAVHELVHMLHFDHSKAFYSEIEKILPDWRNLEKEVDSFKDYYVY